METRRLDGTCAAVSGLQHKRTIIHARPRHAAPADALPASATSTHSDHVQHERELPAESADGWHDPAATTEPVGAGVLPGRLQRPAPGPHEPIPESVHCVKSVWWQPIRRSTIVPELPASAARVQRAGQDVQARRLQQQQELELEPRQRLSEQSRQTAVHPEEQPDAVQQFQPGWRLQ